jgi:hypothetical protein
VIQAAGGAKSRLANSRASDTGVCRTDSGGCDARQLLRIEVDGHGAEVLEWHGQADRTRAVEWLSEEK